MTKLQLPNLNQHDSQYQEKQQYKQPQQVLSWQTLITLKSTLDVSLDVQTVPIWNYKSHKSHESKLELTLDDQTGF